MTDISGVTGSISEEESPACQPTYVLLFLQYSNSLTNSFDHMKSRAYEFDGLDVDLPGAGLIAFAVLLSKRQTELAVFRASWHFHVPFQHFLSFTNTQVRAVSILVLYEASNE